MTDYTPKTKDYQGVELTAQLQPHDAKRERLSIEFTVSGASYNNAKLLPKGVSDEVHQAALTELELWAHTIIDENLK